MKPEDVIKRDVGSQSKGPRLQRLRAIELMLDAIESSDYAHVYSAVESGGDVSLCQHSVTGTAEYHEEDKNYCEGTTFTLVSVEVKNSLVIFLDCWIAKSCSSEVSFGFYATATIGREKKSQKSQSLGIEWPDQPVLETLQGGKCGTEIVEIVRTVVLDEYRTQYSPTVAPEPRTSQSDDRCSGARRNTRRSGHLPVIEGWGIDEWKGFLERIRWGFGQDDDKVLETNLVQKIQRSRHYDYQLAGKERLIVSALLSLLDQRQSLPDPVARFVYASDVILIFRNAAAGTLKLPDPAWRLWESLAPPTDTRNLADKVGAVAKDVSPKQLGRWRRSASDSLYTQQQAASDKSVLALKYRIFEACEPVLENLIQDSQGQELTAKILDEWVGTLFQTCKRHVGDRSQDFTYPLRSDAFLVNTIWELVDSCYLAFDMEGANGS